MLLSRMTILCAAILSAPFLLSMHSYAQLILDQSIEDICAQVEPGTARRTTVYVDTSSIKPGEIEWGMTILNRLSLGPREWLTIFAVDPASLDIREVFNLCYPMASKEEIAAARRERGLLDWLVQFDPERQQRENLEVFESKLRNALDVIYTLAAKSTTGPRKGVLNAIALDKSRFEGRDVFYRIIIFTVSPLASPTQTLAVSDLRPVVTNLVEAYPASFGGAEVFIFGSSETSSEELSIAAREALVGAYLNESWALLRSMSSALPEQAGGEFEPISHFSGNFEGGGTRGGAELFFSVGRDGKVPLAWLRFLTTHGTLNVPVGGVQECVEKDCAMSATVLADVPPLVPQPFFRKGDRVSLTGDESGWEGVLEAAVPEVFNVGGESVAYRFKLRDK